MDYLHLAVIFPLLGAVLNGIFGRWLPKKLCAFIASLSVFLSFIVSLQALIFYLSSKVMAVEGQYSYSLLSWLNVEGLKANWGFLVDPLSLLMALTVSFVSFLIHIYSIGYMWKDEGFSRYFTYLNLFVAMMMLLITADNLILMFVGWEGVGLCSYLLIGFWYRKNAPPIAGMKAFVVNRIGDFGFLLGIFLVIWTFGTAEFVELSKKLEVEPELSPVLIGLIALFLFAGAIGKSAQFPLHVWLPDAMEGPTPVSALIHAATMVTAGVYMVARMNFLYIWSETAMLVVAFLGAFTAFFSASMALVNNDIKRVLAYSTISQLGYMFLAVGLGAFWVGMFHLVAQAFVKALLFLSAGAVLHALDEELDMRKMGGLAKFMPQTYLNYLIGAMAISGIPLLSGFFSKDQILSSAYLSKPLALPQAGQILWVIGIATAVMTAFYMFRQIFLIFLTKPRFAKHLHPHDPPRVMLAPMWTLAVGSVFVGYIGLPPLFVAVFGIPNIIQPFLGKVLAFAKVEELHLPEVSKLKEFSQEALLTFISIIAVLAGLLIAYYFYKMRLGITDRLKRIFKEPYETLLNKYYLDDTYNRVFVEGGKKFANFLDIEVDRGFVDGFVNSLAFIIGALGQLLRALQTGFIRNYVWYVAVGAVMIVLILWRTFVG